MRRVQIEPSCSHAEGSSIGAKNSIHKVGTKRTVEGLKKNLMKGS